MLILHIVGKTHGGEGQALSQEMSYQGSPARLHNSKNSAFCWDPGKSWVVNSCHDVNGTPTIMAKKLLNWAAVLMMGRGQG